MNNIKNDKIQTISTIMHENDISIEDIYKATLEDKQSLNVTSWVGATMILAACSFLAQHIKIGNFRYFLPVILSLAFTYSLLFLRGKPNFSKYSHIVNIVAFALFVFGVNIIFDEYGKETNSLYIGVIVSICLLFQQYSLYKLKKSESCIWIMLFLSGIISLNLLEITLTLKDTLTISIASLITLALTYFFAKNNYIRSLPLLYFISSGTFGVTSIVYCSQLEIASEFYLLTPCALFAMSQILKSRTILFISCIALLSSLLVIFGARLKDTAIIIAVAGTFLIIGIFFLIFGLRSRAKEKQS